MPSKNKSSRRPTHKTLSYCNLEPRKLLASITLQGSTLLIDGSSGDDIIRVTPTGGDSITARLITPSQTLNETFPMDSIGSIEVTGRNGDDLFNNITNRQSTFHGNGGDDIGLGGYGRDTFIGGNGNDFFFGRQGADEAFGGSGNDRLLGFDGDDILDGQDGNDFVNGGAGDDQISGSNGNDRLLGFDGNDTISGGWGDDFVAGGDGEDQLFGDQGHDTLRGGGDADTLDGGSGSDLILGDQGNDVSHGGEGRDYIFDLFGEASQIFGDAGNDILTGGSGDDVIHGGDGNDRIFGAGGDDSLFGDANADYLNGGEGLDGLFGGIDAADQLIGGAGSDRILVFVNQSQNNGKTADIVVDATAQDAVLSFVSNLQITTDRVYQAGRWTDAEIETVDGALRNVHQESGDAQLLKLANGGDQAFVRLGNIQTSNGSPILGVNFHNSHYLALTRNLFEDFEDRIRETVYHELAHNFDTIDENPYINQFRAISNWDQVEQSGDRLSLDGKWYYNDDFDNFLRAYARTNPLEDFAVTFAEYFQRKYDGFKRAFVNPVEKFAVIESFVQS